MQLFPEKAAGRHLASYEAPEFLSVALFLIALLPVQPAKIKDTTIEITVTYSYGYLFKTALEDAIAPAFMTEYPNIRVSFEPFDDSYEEGAARIIEQAETDDLPDISFQGINQQRTLITHNLAVPLDDFIREDSEWQNHGVNSNMTELCKFNKNIYGIPFAISTPAFLYNADLVRKAGYDPDNLPVDWEGILELGSRIDALGPDIYGLMYDYEATGSWLFQALIFSKGGKMTSSDEKRVAFAGERGRWAMRLFDRMVKEGGMPSIPTFRDSGPTRVSEQSWGGVIDQMLAKGRLGIVTISSGAIGYFQREIGEKYETRTGVFPGVVSEIGGLPVGGNVAMMFARDPRKQEAAWKFIKFASSPRGQTLQVTHTGYMPSNALAVKDPVLLGRYYERHPLEQTAIDQILLARQWYAFPGPNTLEITKLIEQHIRSVVVQEVDPETALKKMVDEVEALLPE